MKAAPQTESELQTLAECENAMHRLLVHMTKRESLQADRDRLIAEANRKFQPGIDILLQRERELQMQLQQYYMVHAEQIEKNGEKILHLSSGLMGMRLTAPSLKLLNRSWTWPAVMAKLRTVFGDRFERVPPAEIDKRRVKTELTAAELKQYGLKLDQEEIFYAEPLRPATSDAAQPGHGVVAAMQ